MRVYNFNGDIFLPFNIPSEESSAKGTKSKHVILNLKPLSQKVQMSGFMFLIVKMLMIFGGDFGVFLPD
jgi:hypothetical protein